MVCFIYNTQCILHMTYFHSPSLLKAIPIPVYAMSLQENLRIVTRYFRTQILNFDISYYINRGLLLIKKN